MGEKTFYRFGHGKPEKEGGNKETFGGKGYALRRMSDLGMPVPPGITIPTDVCVQYMHADDAQDYISAIVDAIKPSIQEISDERGGCLFSVRSGARQSMPGMMDTILNIGITHDNYPYWADRLGSEFAALDCYRRLVQMYGEVVHGIEPHVFSNLIEGGQSSNGKPLEDFTATEMLDLCKVFEYDFKTETGLDFPQSLEEQLTGAVRAVFDSWNNPRAIEYRKHYGIPDEWGTAVNIQSMVFGNLNDESCTGVLFTRNPSTGENTLTGEWLPKAQGEDVVAGTHTPRNIYDMPEWNTEVFQQLCSLASKLELHFGDMQDIEFTVENGELFLLQTRRGKRTNIAAMTIAREMILAGYDPATILNAIDRNVPLQLDSGKVTGTAAPIAQGLPAGGKPVTGRAVFSAEEAVVKAAYGPVILVATETTPNDLSGMIAAKGILTAKGGFTSHAAVVSRGMNKTAVVGCNDVNVIDNAMTTNEVSVTEGQWLTIDGLTGKVWAGEQPIETVSGDAEIKRLIRAMPAYSNRTGTGTCADAALPNGIVYRTHHLDHRPITAADLSDMATAISSEGVVVFDIRKPTRRQPDTDLLDFMALGNDCERKLGCLVLLGYTGYVLSDLDETVVNNAGMKLIKKPETVRDLLEHEHLTMDSESIARLFGDEQTKDTVLQALEAAGTPVKAKALPDSICLYDFIDEWFGKSQ